MVINRFSKRWAVLVITSLFSSMTMGQVIFEDSFGSNDSLKNWNTYVADTKIVDKALEISLTERPKANGPAGLSKTLPADLTAGRRLKLSAQIKGENVAPAKEMWNGGKFMLAITYGKNQNNWLQANVKTGTFDWEDVKFYVFTNQNLTRAMLNIGFQDSFGKLFFRNLKVEITDTFLDFSKAANMGLADDVEGDGKGGWSDQGQDNDAKKFDFKAPMYANVPFMPLDPAQNNNKSIITFNSGKFPAGVDKVSFDISDKKAKAKYLYLLHTLCWGAGNQTAGSIKVTGSNDKTQVIEVKSARDVADWWSPKNISNGFVGAAWTTTSGGRVGMYVSRFALNSDIGEIKKIELISANLTPIWIVAAATLSDTEYKFPSTEKFTTKADAVWKPVNRAGKPNIVENSALDRSKFLPGSKAGSQGRVIVNRNGQLAFEKKPATPVRFLSSCEGTDSFWGRGGVAPAQFTSHETIAEYVKELKNNGYNMTRTHFIDTILMRGGKGDCDFNPEALDTFDYFVYCLKENGIYLNWDAMSSWTGYTTLSPWDAKVSGKSDFKYRIHFDPSVKKNWSDGVKKILTRVNPYTKTRLVDDPVLALIVGFNEQEFAFIYDFDGTLALPSWREFLSKRYGSIDKLKAAWGKDAPDVTDFSKIPAFVKADFQSKSAKGADVGRFVKETEINTANWYRNELRGLGYKGPVSGYNMGKNYHYSAVRNALDAVTMNTYHAHPSNYMQSGSTISQDSSIAACGGVFRWAIGGKLAQKPFAITEYANTFWNRYRYEQAFVNGAYGAFQDVDVLTNFAQPVSIVKVERINPFLTMNDPILRAMEFLTFFMYCRGDVKSANAKVRIVADSEDIYNTQAFNDAITANQSKLCLVSGFSVESIDDKTKRPVIAENELEIPRIGGAGVKNDIAGFASVSSEKGNVIFNADRVVDELKKRNLIKSGNRTRMANDVFENSTGELYMDSRRNFMSVITPNLQGICAEDGAKIDMGNLKIDEMSVKGNLSLVSVDDNKSLQTSDRMVLVFATDALNNKMSFDEKERLTLRDIGGSPTLVETGKFTVTVKTDNADKLKIWALDLSGNRRLEIKPAKASAGEITFSVDTAKLPDGPSLFFELQK
jgi:hypothetical protein